MGKGIRVHESGVGLTEEQKIDVEDVFLKVWQNKIKPEMTGLIKNTTDKSCNECKRIDDIDLWFGKTKIMNKSIYIASIILLFLFVIGVVNLLI